jgi:alcohol dehydrogenase class IV
MNEQELLSVDALRSLPPDETALWVTPSVRSTVEGELGLRVLPHLQPLPDDVRTLVVVAGGTLMDEAKVWRVRQNPKIRLIEVPSIWGSGAEASPIAVLNRNGKKEIRIGEEFLPDARCIWPELAASVPDLRARHACGDCWAHALEGFLSPLCSEPLRVEIAALLNEILDMPLSAHPDWYDLSARACAAQARSSVGLVHGIAHVLEGILEEEQPSAGWSHSRLCSTLLLPVMRYNEQASQKWQTLIEHHSLSAKSILTVLEKLYEPECFEAALPRISERWIDILRDPCSRTNSTTVRPASLEYFELRSFL